MISRRLFLWWAAVAAAAPSAVKPSAAAPQTTPDTRLMAKQPVAMFYNPDGCVGLIRSDGTFTEYETRQRVR